MNYEIKITGSGTKSEIVSSLEAMIKSICDYDGEGKFTMEDQTLCGEINEDLCIIGTRFENDLDNEVFDNEKYDYEITYNENAKYYELSIYSDAKIGEEKAVYIYYDKDTAKQDIDSAGKLFDIEFNNVATIDSEYPYTVYVGTKEAMEIAAKGVNGLNKKTMRPQLVNKTAKYKLVKDPQSETGWMLLSNLDLRTIAKQNGLIM